ncbi:nitroreductase [Roseivirga sp. E12]|uniref:nitroreductase family protein n=1 Tax=Roseivirga sp. E12 TaxID=2819237 RepID=UPI001ABC6BA1|nr:nitroreductase [Roseivirga sp. E12]MBO3698735.1 nitroreductase [Roseivirga sp. E12]
MPDFNSELVNQLLKERRSIYPAQYTGEPVDEKVIKDMIENANWAPTHRYTEPWRFMVFSGDGLKKLADFQSNLYKEASTRAGNFDESKFQKLATKPLLSSHIIAIGMVRDPKESVPEVEEVSSVAMAVQNMYLTATGHGVGCYWGTGGVTFYEEAKPFFKLGAKDRLLGFLYVGSINKEKWPKGKRRPIDDKVEWVY